MGVKEVKRNENVRVTSGQFIFEGQPGRKLIMRNSLISDAFQIHQLNPQTVPSIEIMTPPIVFFELDETTKKIFNPIEAKTTMTKPQTLSFFLFCSEGSNHSIFKNRKKQLHYKMSKKLIYQLTSKSVSPWGFIYP